MKRVWGISWPFFAAFILFAALFILFPGIDVWFSNLFWNPTHYFSLNETPVIMSIYYSVEVLCVGVIIALLILLAATWFKKKPILKMTFKDVFYLLIVLAVGPGIVVNLVSKNVCGRARPKYIEQFGGDQTFTPAFFYSDQCQSNCSFVSGHAAFGFYFIAFAFIFPAHRRKIFAAAMTYGAIVGLGRISQGGHFLSDVIFAFLFVYFIAKGTHYLMFERSKAAPPS